MKKMTVYIIGGVVALIILLIGAKLITSKVGKDINDFYHPYREHTFSKTLFLKNVDFNSGNYALYIKHKDFGEFMVLDKQGLIKNQDSLEISRSWINFLPGEGDRSFGVMLFKNNQFVSGNTGGIFKKFEIGSLTDYAIPVKSHRFYGVKKPIEDKINILKNDKNNYIVHQPTLPKEDKEFHFRVYFPSIAVPVTREKDGSGHEQIKTINGFPDDAWRLQNVKYFEEKWRNQLKNCINKKAGKITDFDISITANTLNQAYIFDATKNWADEIRTANKKILYINGYMYYNFIAYIKASKKNAAQLLTLDYSGCINEEERNKPQVVAEMKKLVKQSTKPKLSVDNGEVGLDGYKDKVSKYKELYEQEYFLKWLELEN